MKTAKTKSKGLQEGDVLNLKSGEVGLKLSVRKRGQKVKHFTSKGKIKNAEYFLASLVKTYLKVLGMKDDIDLVKYDDVDISLSGKEKKDLKDNEARTQAMLGIQKEIEKASKNCQHNKPWGECCNKTK